MYLERISILNFKNIAEAEIEFSANVNCLVGDNGTGKTNLADAVWYLSMSKSSVGLTDGQSVRHGEDFFMLDGRYILGGERRESIVCSFRRSSGKVIKRNGKEYDRVTEHIGLLPIVLVSPSDTALIHESGDERRRFLNTFLSQTDRDYLAAIVKYNRLLQERNRLLKSGSPGEFGEILEILDLQLAEVGTTVHDKRAGMIERLAPKAAEYYAILSADREQVSISYRSELSERPFGALLEASRERDRVCGFTNCGIHRDDIKLEISGFPIRKYGSQGQQKSMLLALKLAQFDLIRELKQIKPILLLDDVFDKLDMARVEQLIGMVSSDRFGQIFITDSNKVRMEGILAQLTENYKLFEVSAGRFRELQKPPTQTE